MHLELHGTRVPSIGFGTFRIAGGEAVEAVRDALDLGYRHVDTAPVYDNEREVGEGIRRSGVPREQIWLTTKVWLSDLTADRLRASAERSLRDLGTGYVDLLLIHWPNPDVPLEETIGALERLREEGLIRHHGVSNFPPGLFRRALSLAPVLTNQVEFHPYLGQDELVAIAAEHDSSVTAYSPVARGRVLHDPVLKEIAAAHGTGTAQVALAWLLAHEHVLVVPKAASRSNREANLAALDVRLSPDELGRIDALPKHRRDQDPSWAPDWNG